MCVLGLLTFLYRFAFVSNLGKKLADKIPIQFLQLLAPATFAAIIVNNMISSHTDSTSLTPRFTVATICLGLAYWTESILLTLLVGLTTLYFL